jgi:hypothetical protein
MTISNGKGGSYLIDGDGGSIRVAVANALAAYENERRLFAKSRPTLNRLAKEQTIVTMTIRHVAD